MAQPDLTRKADVSVLRQTHNAYRFHTLYFDSADHQRHYRVFVGVPQQKPTPEGFPAFYALDGNAMLAELTAPRLRSLAASDSAPVIVLLGYASDLRLDVVSRAYDYTVTDGNTEAADALHPQRRNGGADAFLTLLADHIMPSVHRLAPINAARQAFWGHSYGGLLVLHTLLTRPHLFSRYIAADPAIWVGNGAILATTSRWTQQHTPLPPTQLWLMKSGAMANSPPARTAAAAAQQAHIRTLRQQAPQALPEFIQQLRNHEPALSVRYDVYPQDTHGSLLTTSFRAALFDGRTPHATP